MAFAGDAPRGSSRYPLGVSTFLGWGSVEVSELVERPPLLQAVGGGGWEKRAGVMRVFGSDCDPSYFPATNGKIAPRLA